MELKSEGLQLVATADGGSNRTFMELKLRIAAAHHSPRLVLIVPLWN